MFNKKITLEDPNANATKGSIRVYNRIIQSDSQGRIVSSMDKNHISIYVKDVMGSSTIFNSYSNKSSHLQINKLIDQDQMFKVMHPVKRLTIYVGVRGRFPMDLHSLLCFQIVARLENMTKAAEMLQVSQPAIRKLIGNLEKELTKFRVFIQEYFKESATNNSL